MLWGRVWDVHSLDLLIQNCLWGGKVRIFWKFTLSPYSDSWVVSLPRVPSVGSGEKTHKGSTFKGKSLFLLLRIWSHMEAVTMGATPWNKTQLFPFDVWPFVSWWRFLVRDLFTTGSANFLKVCLASVTSSQSLQLTWMAGGWRSLVSPAVAAARAHALHCCPYSTFISILSCVCFVWSLFLSKNVFLIYEIENFY